MSRLSAADVHAAVVGRWPAVLASLGIDDAHLSRRHGPCPCCGGRDRFRFDDREGRGTWYCNQCGAGDGFALLMRVHGWGFEEALREVAAVAGVDSLPPAPRNAPRPAPAPDAPARPTERVRGLLRTATTPDLVPDAVAYLAGRHLWPLPAGCTLRAHVAAEYYRPGVGRAVELIGRFPALVAPVHDVAGELVTAHVTYLHAGTKLDRDGCPARKILSPMTGRVGCAARLLPLAGDVLGVAEGMETALSAAARHGVPCWAALNAGLLARFMPPAEVRHVLIFADRDAAGLEAAYHLREHLDGRATCELRLPPSPCGDWNDALRGAGHG
ncbi:MAG: toprim domain-containing protein [Gammaproteobacteria bacterium]|nr:toprim domain-containing protein [Gammaproteobacteria bacterium]